MIHFWNLFARAITRPRVLAWLIRQAYKRPYVHLGGYMHRWWLVPETWRLPFAIRVHHILREDADPFLHDHPWNWRTVVLRGWYVEEDVFGQHHFRMAGATRAATAETLHRISQVPKEGVWTLFITGRRKNRWGFLVGEPSRKIHWREYESANGRTDPRASNGARV